MGEGKQFVGGRETPTQNIHIDLGHSTDEHLKFTFIEDMDQVLRDKLAEARHKGVKLLLDTSRDTMFDHGPEEVGCQ
jgi:hypothetical protein